MPGTIPLLVSLVNGFCRFSADFKVVAEQCVIWYNKAWCKKYTKPAKTTVLVSLEDDENLY